MSLNTPQPRPQPGTGEPVWDIVRRALARGSRARDRQIAQLVIADTLERDRLGEAKYGQRLQAHDGRDSLVDAYQEALDSSVYLGKASLEAPAPRKAVLEGLFGHAIALAVHIRAELYARDGR